LNLSSILKQVSYINLRRAITKKEWLFMRDSVLNNSANQKKMSPSNSNRMKNSAILSRFVLLYS
jgi:hypothetical protein